MAKSELLAAYCPSRPRMPTPTWALRIMLTSLAPSPIANVTFFGNFYLIIITMSDFYFGLTLQAKTTSVMTAASKNKSFNSFFYSIIVRDYPDMTMAYLLFWFFF